MLAVLLFIVVFFNASFCFVCLKENFDFNIVFSVDYVVFLFHQQYTYFTNVWDFALMQIFYNEDLQIFIEISLV